MAATLSFYKVIFNGLNQRFYLFTIPIKRNLTKLSGNYGNK